MAEEKRWLPSLGHASLGTLAISSSRSRDYPCRWASSRVCCIAWFWLAAIGPKDSPTLQLMWPRQHKLLAAINISLVI